jgi:hypothetical protein
VMPQTFAELQHWFTQTAPTAAPHGPPGCALISGDAEKDTEGVRDAVVLIDFDDDAVADRVPVAVRVEVKDVEAETELDAEGVSDDELEAGVDIV